MKRTRSQVDSDIENDILLSDSEADELEEDLKVYLNSKQKSRSRRVIQNNIAALEEKFSEMRLINKDGEPLPWVETLVVDTDKPLVIPNVDDDLERETIIYKSTLENVLKGIAMCDEQGIKHRRPDDYFAEMVKSDEHMLGLKDHLLGEQRRRDEKNKEIAEREMKKYAKKVQVETQLRRQKQKAEDLAVVKEWRKRHNKDSKDEFPDHLLDPKNPERKQFLSKANFQMPKSKKSQAKDAKYGHGGVKRFKRSNDSSSSADMSSYSARKNAALKGKQKNNGFPQNPPKSGGFGHRAKKTTTHRPGKNARRKMGP